MTGSGNDASDDGAATNAAAGNDPLLAFLAQPRRLGEVRLHFGPDAEVALKRLSRLLVSGEVEQPGFGVVVRAGCLWEAWPLPLRQAKLLAVLDHPMHRLDAAGRASVTSGAASAMAALVATGRVRCEPGGMYVRTVTVPAYSGGIEHSEASNGPGAPVATSAGKQEANRAQLLAVLSGTRSVAEIAGLMGSSQDKMISRLWHMAGRGQAIRVGYGLYSAPSSGASRRSSPVRTPVRSRSGTPFLPSCPSRAKRGRWRRTSDAAFRMQPAT